MNDFFFVDDEDMRQSLTQDNHELELAMQAGAWKSALVLAGNIVETILLWYLISSDYQTRKGKDPSYFTLGQAIDACVQDGVLSDRTEKLCSVIKDYRNLIHPGLVVRLSQRCDQASAQVAKSVLHLILTEIGPVLEPKERRTAASILDKITRDPNSRSLISHLLKGLKQGELSHLMFKEIWPKYIELMSADGLEEWDYSVAQSMQNAFHDAFDLAQDPLKKSVAHHMARLFKEGSRYEISAIQQGLMQGYHIAHLDDPDRRIVLDYIFDQAQSDPSVSVLRVIESGLARALKYPDEAERFAFCLINAGYLRIRGNAEQAKEILRDTSWTTPEQEHLIDEALRTLESQFDEVGGLDGVNACQDALRARGYVFYARDSDDVPF